MALPHKEYWRDRFEILEEVLHQESIQTYQEVEQAFQEAQHQIQKDIELWVGRVAVNNGISNAEAHTLLSKNQLAEFHWDVEQYIQYGRENAIDQRWAKELENASAKFHLTKLQALEISTQQALEKAFAIEDKKVYSMAEKTLTDGYQRTLFELQKGTGVGFDVSGLDRNKLENIIPKPWAKDGKNFSDRIWGDREKMVKALHKQLSDLALSGKSPENAIDFMTDYLHKDFSDTKGQGARYCARRLIETESAYFSAVARHEAYVEMGDEAYEILAIRDGKTSKICKGQDGKVYQMDEWKVGVTAPPFHCWCRSTDVPYFEGEWNDYGSQLVTNGNEEYLIPNDMDYEEWEEKFLHDGSKEGLQKVDNHGIVEWKRGDSIETQGTAPVEDVVKPLDTGEIQWTDVVIELEKGSGKINYTIDSDGFVHANATPKIYSDNLLPNLGKLCISTQKLTGYALNPNHPDGKNKATVFKSALGYDLTNYEVLLSEIVEKINQYPAVPRGNKGYGETYQVIIPIHGVNGRTVDVLTSWVDHNKTGKLSLTSVYVYKGG